MEREKGRKAQRKGRIQEGEEKRGEELFKYFSISFARRLTLLHLIMDITQSVPTYLRTFSKMMSLPCYWCSQLECFVSITLFISGLQRLLHWGSPSVVIIELLYSLISTLNLKMASAF